MTNDANNTLMEWWNNVSFEGKELFTLNDTGELILKANGDTAERTIATLTDADADTQLAALQEKYSEATAKVNELATAWTETEDKLSLASKTEKLKEYLQHVNAAGPFDQLWKLVNDWDQTVHTLSENNYNAKLKLAEKAEELAVSENWKEASQGFRDIAEQWKQTGYLDKKRNSALWNRIEASRTRFFERKRHNHEENEKDILQNLDLKMELAEKAEALANSEKWKETTEAFKQLMEDWKGIGHTIPEKNEELWKRFINAKNAFFDRKKAHTDIIHHELEANLQAKTLLVEKAEALKDSTDWAGTTQALADILEEWKNSGRAVAEKADALWNRMKAAREQFFNAKQEHFTTIKANLQENYLKKQQILNRANELKNDNRWHDATIEMNELMDEWKKIGPVPREHSNKIWEEFLAARKHFFNRKDENREKRKEHIERKKHTQQQQAKSQLHKLEAEIREEEERIADFRNGLLDITPGRKAEELRNHLQTLIAEGEEKIKRNRAKLEQANKALPHNDNSKKAQQEKDTTEKQ